MTQATLHPRPGRQHAARTSRYTPKSLHHNTRILHRPTFHWMNVAWICIAAALGLSLLGVAAISTTEPSYAVKHIVHLFVGLIAAAAMAVPHFRTLKELSYPLLICSILLLIFLLIPFVPDALVHPRNGARRWINLYVTDFQPSELAKITYVLALANWLCYRESYRTLRGLLLPLILTFIPLGLVLVEPDLGTAMLFLPTFFAMLIAAGAKLKHIILIVVLGLSLAPAMYPLLKPHQKARIHAMIAQVQGDPQFENDIGYQGARAMTLVGAGGITGVGKAHAEALVKFNALPEDHNDMIFAVIACRWGLLGAMLTWGLFLALTIGGLIVAALTRDPFGRLVAVGIVALLFAQMAINTGMTIGLTPITGMTLPFVSAGGTSLVTTWMMIGLLLNIAMRTPLRAPRHSFEFDGE